MAEISKIKVSDVLYDIKDAQAREDIETLQASVGTLESAVLDSEMSDTSANGVQNKTIKAYVDAADATKQDSLTEAQLAAVNSGVTADKVTTYDGYAASIAAKQDALSEAQLAATNSGITAAKVVAYDAYDAEIDSKANASDVYTKTEVDSTVSTINDSIATKQDALSTEQLAAVNSGITAEKVAAYDAYEAEIDAKADADSVYTKTEVDNAINTLNTGLDWKESVATYDDIATTYASPEDGWTVNVQDTDVTYRYTGSEWIAISANSIPMADSSTDGKMSSAHYTKVENLTMSVSGETLTLAE